MQFVQTRMQNHPFFMLDVNQHISEVEWALFVNSYKQAFIQQNISTYIVGFATEEMQRNAVNQLFNVSNQQANTNTRNYADLQIQNSMPMTQFLNNLDNFFL